MSDTMSSPNNQWAQFYQHGHNPYGQVVPPSNGTRTTTTMFGGQASGDATAATTTVTSPSNTTTTTSSSSLLNPDQGRVSKPIRRRSRASRRTPTTLLNTDTTNFRAMVQQFTGGTIAVPFASRMSHQSPYGMEVASGYNIMQFQQHQQQQQQQQHDMFLLNNNSTNSHADDHGFFRRLIGSNNTRPSMELADKLEGDGPALRGSLGSGSLGFSEF